MPAEITSTHLTRTETVDLMMRFTDVVKTYETMESQEIDQKTMLEIAVEAFDMAIDVKEKGVIYVPD